MNIVKEQMALTNKSPSVLIIIIEYPFYRKNFTRSLYSMGYHFSVLKMVVVSEKHPLHPYHIAFLRDKMNITPPHYQTR